MTDRRFILVPVSVPEALELGLLSGYTVDHLPDVWASVAEVGPPEGVVLARIVGQPGIFPARRSLVEEGHELYAASFEWSPLPVADRP